MNWVLLSGRTEIFPFAEVIGLHLKVRLWSCVFQDYLLLSSASLVASCTSKDSRHRKSLGMLGERALSWHSLTPSHHHWWSFVPIQHQNLECLTRYLLRKGKRHTCRVEPEVAPVAVLVFPWKRVLAWYHGNSSHRTKKKRNKKIKGIRVIIRRLSKLPLSSWWSTKDYSMKKYAAEKQTYVPLTIRRVQESLCYLRLW